MKSIYMYSCKESGFFLKKNQDTMLMTMVVHLISISLFKKSTCTKKRNSSYHMIKNRYACFYS